MNSRAMGMVSYYLKLDFHAPVISRKICSKEVELGFFTCFFANNLAKNEENPMLNLPSIHFSMALRLVTC